MSFIAFTVTHHLLFVWGVRWFLFGTVFGAITFGIPLLFQKHPSWKVSNRTDNDPLSTTRIHQWASLLALAIGVLLPAGALATA